MSGDDALYIVHILERIDRIEEYVAAGQERFMSDQMTQDAVIRNLEVIGEATKRISRETKASTPDVPWKLMAGLRDVLIHNYNGVLLVRVWDAIQQDLPKLRPPLQALFARLREETQS